MIKYRNVNESFDRFTTRTVRKLIRLFNVNEEDLSIDLKWVEEKLKQEQVLVQFDVQESEANVKCVHCCCKEHCRVQIHNFSKTKRKVPVKPIMSELNFGFETNVSEWQASDVDHDLEATASNLFVQEAGNFQEILFGDIFKS